MEPEEEIQEVAPLLINDSSRNREYRACSIRETDNDVCVNLYKKYMNDDFVTYNVSSFFEKHLSKPQSWHEKAEMFVSRLSHEVAIDIGDPQHDVILSGIHHIVDMYITALGEADGLFRGIRPIKCGSLFSNLRVGRPYEGDIVLLQDDTLFEVTTKLNSQGQIDQFSTGHGHEVFLVDANLPEVQNVANVMRNPRVSLKICPEKFLSRFQTLAIRIWKAMTAPEGWGIEGVMKHGRGVCLKLKHRNHIGVELDLIPVINMPQAESAIYKPQRILAAHASAFRDNSYHLVCDKKRWRVSSSLIDQRITDQLAEDTKEAIRVVKFLLQSRVVVPYELTSVFMGYAVGCRDFFMCRWYTNRSRSRTDHVYYGSKPLIPSHLLLLYIQLLQDACAEKPENELLQGHNLVFLLLDILSQSNFTSMFVPCLTTNGMVKEFCIDRGSVYLTLRTPFLLRKTKQWLEKHINDFDPDDPASAQLGSVKLLASYTPFNILVNFWILCLLLLVLETVVRQFTTSDSGFCDGDSFTTCRIIYTISFALLGFWLLVFAFLNPWCCKAHVRIVNCCIRRN